VDTTQSAQVTITVDPAADPTISSIDPVVTGQGSAQQDVYISGTNFFTTSQVLAGLNQDPVPTTFINTNLIRATIPAADLTGNLGPNVPIQVQAQNKDLNLGGPVNLVLTPVRPAVISSTPDSIPQVAASVGVTLTGGYYSPGTTTATFNGQPVTTSFVDSRHLSLGIPFSGQPDPGLYPILVQNSGVAAPSGVNLAVEPSVVPTSPGTTIPVGTNPSAVAIDNALHQAVIANQGSGSVSIIDLGSNTVINTIAIPTINKGTSAPTSVAIDDVADNQLSHDLALVVDNGDNSVAVIDLVTQSLTQTIDLSPFTPTGSAPISIGINPLTHRAIVANQSTNLATVIDLVTPNPNLAKSCTTPPCVLTTIGGDLPPFFSTGANPAIAIDPRLNWAVITPGGAGTVNIVDLGRNPNAGDGGRQPLAIGSLTITTTMQGVGINTETHEVLLTDPNGTTLTTYSLLDNSVNSTTFSNSGVPFSETGIAAAAVNPLDNLGIVANRNAGTVSVVDLETGNVLGADIPADSPPNSGAKPVAMAVDQGTNRALIVNQADSKVALLTLGTTFRAPQIIEASPAITFAQTANPINLTINGAGFAAGAKVLLDGTALPGNNIVKVTPNQIVATIPAAKLALAHRYIVAVQNPGQMSNLTDLTVVQAVSTGLPGSAPFGVAVDNDRDVAVVTNTGAGNVALIDLTTGILETPTLSSSVTVGTSPQGVAVIPRLGLAVVANNGSNDYTVVDDTGNSPSRTGDCGCLGPNGVAVDQDSVQAAITGSLSNTVNFVNLLASSLTAGATGQVDQGPGAVAIDPNPNVNLEDSVFAAVATDSQASTIDIVNTSGGIAKRVNNLQAPTGVIFDPLNRVFVVANSLQDNLAFIDGSTFNNATVAVGVNPTSLDYNFQTSTLVTANSASNTMSVIEYTCSPITVAGQPVTCLTGPQTRLILGLPGSSLPSQLQQYSVGIDLRMNLAVVADQNNDRVLLIPLPH
jgi:DNA-binding beta-propeller fold protein YncE